MPHPAPVIITTYLLLAGVPLFAQDEEPGNETLDALERRLELGRHQGLVEVKADGTTSLTDFTTDGCSGGLSAGWEFLSLKIERLSEIHGDQPPWQACCVAHDRLYHNAGNLETTTEESFTARKDADNALRACVVETGQTRTPELAEQYDLSASQVALLYETVAGLMYRAVRLGGIPCSGLPWRWGYGWPECK